MPLLVPVWLGLIAAADAGVAAPADAGGEAAVALTRLFARTCLSHVGDPQALRAMLATDHVPRAPSEAAARPGLAYRIDGEPGHLMVLSFDDGWCSDGGTGIDPHALTLRLGGAMRARGIAMQLMGAAPDGREQRYLLTRPAPATPIVLLVLLQPAGSLMQANLFAAPMPLDAPR